MVSTFPSAATQGWVTAHTELLGNFRNSHLVGKYYLSLTIRSVPVIDFILPALSHALCSLVVTFSISVFVWTPFFPLVFFWLSPPFPLQVPLWWGCISESPFPKAFTYLLHRAFWRAALAKQCFTRSSHTPNPVPLSLHLPYSQHRNPAPKGGAPLSTPAQTQQVTWSLFLPSPSHRITHSSAEPI